MVSFIVTSCALAVWVGTVATGSPLPVSKTMSNGTWTRAADLESGRSFPEAVTLPDGTVMLAGESLKCCIEAPIALGPIGRRRAHVAHSLAHTPFVGPRASTQRRPFPFQSVDAFRTVVDTLPDFVLRSNQVTAVE
jgi:hypothetical protein